MDLVGRGRPITEGTQEIVGNGREAVDSGQQAPGDYVEALASLRGSIDNIDAALIHMLAERFRCTQRVGELKAQYDLPPADPAREQRQIARLRRLAEEAQLDPDFAEKFLNFVVKEVIRHHEAIDRQ